MQETLWLGNVRLLLALNHFVADYAGWYQAAAFLSGSLADILATATFVLLWFWPQLRSRRQLQIHEVRRLSPLALFWANLRARWAMDTPREQSRAQVLMVIGAAAPAFLLAHLAAFEWNITRPYLTYLPLRENATEIVGGLETFGSFGADFGVLLGVLGVALFYWDRRMGVFWIGCSIVFAIARVAAGLNFPLDIIGGAILGIVFTKLAFEWYDRRGVFHANCHSLARAFDFKNAPYCYLLYFLLILVALEFMMRFRHILQFVFTLRGDFFS